MHMVIWFRHSKAQWYGNEPQWVIATTTEPELSKTRMDLLVRTDQHTIVMPNTNVHWRGPMDWAITVSGAVPTPALMALSRKNMRRVFGRVFGRVN